LVISSVGITRSRSFQVFMLSVSLVTLRLHCFFFLVSIAN